MKRNNFTEDIANMDISDELRVILYDVLARLFNQRITFEFALELNNNGIFDLLLKFISHSDNRFKISLSEIEKLNVEFTRLFIGPGPHVSQYASVHRTDDHRAGETWGETTVEVKKFIEFYGLKISKPGNIPDHISILFEFMSKIIQTRLDTLNKRNTENRQKAQQIERKFFRDYIDPWINSFLNDVLDMNPLPFYTAVMRLTDNFIDKERALFHNLSF
jgi:TorA maturation chaperone TorD